MRQGLDGACPYLGVPGDSQVYYGYASTLNVCYSTLGGWSQFQPVDVRHQSQFCLTRDHHLCPTYLRSLAASRRGNSQKQGEGYLEFFGLRSEPFSIVPQPEFLVESHSQRQAHTGLRWLIERRQGLGVVLGPVGTGKTLLCKALFEELRTDPQYVPALVLTPNFRSEYALLGQVLAGWKVRPKRNRSVHDLEAGAYGFLQQAVLHENQTPVLILDEAQTLPRPVMQQVCKMLNWQEGGEQLLQVVLAGQPSLEGKLVRLPALRDRTVLQFTLTPMTASEVQQMIGQRLRRAGRQADLFAPSAVQLIYEHTGGMPRRVTVLCLLCLWLAYEQGKRFVSAELVRSVLDWTRSRSQLAAFEDASELFAAWPVEGHEPTPGRLTRSLRRLWPRRAG